MKLISIFFVLIISYNSYSKELTVGCVTKCDIFFKIAIKRVSKSFGLKSKIIDMSKEYPNIQWEKYDAIILPGGADIDPKYYLSAVEQDLQEYTRSLDYLVNYSSEGKRRDPIEFNTLKEYFLREDLYNLPILGVCRGMQMLAVSQGIPLYVDIKKEIGIRNRRYLFDRIHVDQDPSLMNALFSKSFLAFKRHHQGIRIEYFNSHKDRWPNLRLTSFSNSRKIAESIEFDDRPILGVQFHPENDFGYERKRIFNWLIERAVERSNEKVIKK